MGTCLALGKPRCQASPSLARLATDPGRGAAQRLEARAVVLELAAVQHARVPGRPGPQLAHLRDLVRRVDGARVAVGARVAPDHVADERIGGAPDAEGVGQQDRSLDLAQFGVVEFQPSSWTRGSYLNVGAMWLWRDTGDPARMASHAEAAFGTCCRACRCSWSSGAATARRRFLGEPRRVRGGHRGLLSRAAAAASSAGKPYR